MRDRLYATFKGNEVTVSRRPMSQSLVGVERHAFATLEDAVEYMKSARSEHFYYGVMIQGKGGRELTNEEVDWLLAD